ncbi:hypothetical protein, partial [Nocardia cyriacigeorgica]|uniref:hypothetical protein n=1 Tax=Nocardia cyriacigeorgica TaxID=135487 RepID=UPI0024582ACD
RCRDPGRSAFSLSQQQQVDHDGTEAYRDHYEQRDRVGAAGRARVGGASLRPRPWPRPPPPPPPPPPAAPPPPASGRRSGWG